MPERNNPSVRQSKCCQNGWYTLALPTSNSSFLLPGNCSDSSSSDRVNHEEQCWVRITLLYRAIGDMLNVHSSHWLASRSPVCAVHSLPDVLSSILHRCNMYDPYFLACIAPYAQIISLGCCWKDSCTLHCYFLSSPCGENVKSIYQRS